MAHRSTIAEAREEWGSSETDPPGHRIGKVSRVIIHHWWRPDIPPDASVEMERQAMRDVEHFHTEGGRGWDDYGYQFTSFDSGRAYEGRGWGHSGAHTKGLNSSSVAISFPINGDENDATEAAYRTTRELIREGIELGYISPDYTLSGHRDHASKGCPGSKVYSEMFKQLSPERVAKGEIKEEKGWDELASKEEIREVVREEIDRYAASYLVQHHLKAKLNDVFHRAREIKGITKATAEQGVEVDSDAIARAVADEQARRLEE